MQEGASYKVKVVRLMDYGAFVELPNGFQALLHISELAYERVTCPRSTIWSYTHSVPLLMAASA